MAKSVFRKKSLERLSSPEQLDSYIRVAKPSMWIVLGAIVLILIGFAVWVIFGRLSTILPCTALVDNKVAVCYIPDKTASNIKVGSTIEINDKQYNVEAVSNPKQIDEYSDKYYLHEAGLNEGEWVKVVTVYTDLNDGVYSAGITTDTVSPLDFLFN